MKKTSPLKQYSTQANTVLAQTGALYRECQIYKNRFESILPFVRENVYLLVNTHKVKKADIARAIGRKQDYIDYMLEKYEREVRNHD